MSELGKKEQRAIEHLKMFCWQDEGYYLADSGGKDSSVCRALLKLAGVKYDSHYRVTSVDPPELVQFIKKYHPETEREIPRDYDGNPITMWNLISKKGIPPTRKIRYCCKELKEDSGDGRLVVTGVRWAESNNRARNAGLAVIPSSRAAEELKGKGNFQSTPKGGGWCLRMTTPNRGY